MKSDQHYDCKISYDQWVKGHAGKRYEIKMGSRGQCSFNADENKIQ